MNSASTTPPPIDSMVLNVFCARESEGFRVYLAPGWVPRYLQICFDSAGVANHAHLDFEELERTMRKRGHAYECRPSNRGDRELKARGAAAGALAAWLASAFASGVRTPA